MKIFFTTYASGAYRKNIFLNLLFIRLFIRPHKIFILTDDDLKKSEIYKKNLSIFTSHPAGHYAWKPWVILQAMKKCDEGDFVIYQDCGKGLRFKNIIKPRALLNHADTYGAMPGIVVAAHGKNKNWCTNTCFEKMGCDNDLVRNGPHIEAVISIWKKELKTIEFLEKWMEFCTDEETIRSPSSQDLSNESDDFFQHRYDQAILTNLIYLYDFRPFFPTFPNVNITKSMSLIELDARSYRFVSLIIKIYSLVKKK
jgi:hypothetical protein